MTEAQISGKIKGYLRHEEPQAVLFKHNDRITAAVPDLSATLDGRTLWIETKYLRRGEPPSGVRKHFDQVQLLMLRRMGPAAVYAVAYHHPIEPWLNMALVRPERVHNFLVDHEYPYPALMEGYAMAYGPLEYGIQQLARLLRRKG